MHQAGLASDNRMFHHDTSRVPQLIGFLIHVPG